MGIGVPRALRDILSCSFPVAMQIPRAGMDFKAAWGSISDLIRAFSCNSPSLVNDARVV